MTPGHSALYLWLTYFLIKAAKPDKPAEDKKVTEKVSAIFSMEFLQGKGQRYLEKIQIVTREYTSYLLEAGKPIHGIAPIMRAIKVLSRSDEEVSSLHTQFAKLCLKSRCF